VLTCYDPRRGADFRFKLANREFSSLSEGFLVIASEPVRWRWTAKDPIRWAVRRALSCLSATAREDSRGVMSDRNVRVFEDGSSVAWIHRENVRYSENGFSVLVWVDWGPGFFRRCQ
jgi:hypothetical protein